MFDQFQTVRNGLQLAFFNKNQHRYPEEENDCYIYFTMLEPNKKLEFDIKESEMKVLSRVDHQICSEEVSGFESLCS